MSTPSDPRLLVMHGLRLKGFADAGTVAQAVDVPEDAAAACLTDLINADLVTYRDGRLAGFALTAAGRAHHAQLLSAELDAEGVRAAIADAYRRFLGLNGSLLEVCTSWQLRDVEGTPTINDHRDLAYDESVIDELGALHERVQPICTELAVALDRYGAYGPRLSHALARVRAGDGEWFAKPVISSYHTVWFELHEDLLATLGIERSAEAVG